MVVKSFLFNKSERENENDFFSERIVNFGSDPEAFANNPKSKIGKKMKGLMISSLLTFEMKNP